MEVGFISPLSYVLLYTKDDLLLCMKDVLGVVSLRMASVGSHV